MVSKGRIRRQFLTSAVALFLCASAVAIQPAAAAPADVGYRDHYYGTSVTAPTGQKPQSKLFYNDGSWWGVLFSIPDDAFNVYKLNSVTQEWSDTGVIVEPRDSAQFDVLFVGNKLYVASGNISPTATAPTVLRRFSYSSSSGFSLDQGFPATIVDGGMEAGVIDMDSTGTLWFTYTRSNTVYVTRSDGNDSTWIAPFVVPTDGATGLFDEDESALVSYDGKIGLMWSNQTEDAMYFASHNDGDPDTAWLLNPAVQLPEYADDHMNLKSIQATNDGRVFAATKTSLNNGNAPLILLLELKQNGTWSRHNVWSVGDDVTRPMVLLDEENGKVFMFATGPCCSGGKVYMKESPLNNVSFPNGLGTVFLESSLDPKINNITSTKQPLNSTTGLVAIAGDDSTRTYLHNSLPLGPIGQDLTPPAVTFPKPTVFIDQSSPQTVGGTVTDAGSGVDRVEIIALDLGAAGAPGVEGLRAWTDQDQWEQVTDAPVLQADLTGNSWSFEWDPIPGGSGSYVIGIRAYDVVGNKWPANKPWQALVVISDVTKPSIVIDDPVVVGNTITWSGSASDDLVIRRTRMIIRHIESNEYWNGEGWVDKDQALADLADPNRPNIIIFPEQSAPLSPNVDWSYSLTTDRVGSFQTLHWAQNGAYTWTDFDPTVRIVTLG